MAKLQYDKTGRLLFTKEMKKEYTILFPMMAPIHFNIIKDVFTHYGYKAVLLETTGPQIAQTGLKYVHNDTCYPALLVIGQMIDALESGKYDINDHPDRRRLPGVQLHPSSAEGIEKGRL